MTSAVASEGPFLRLLLRSTNKLRKIILLEADIDRIKSITEILLNLDVCGLKTCKKLKTVKNFLKKKKFCIKATRKFFIKKR